MASVFFDWNQREKLVGFGSSLLNWFIITLNFFSKKQVIWTLSEMELWLPPAPSLSSSLELSELSASSGRASGHLEGKVAYLQGGGKGKIAFIYPKLGSYINSPVALPCPVRCL